MGDYFYDVGQVFVGYGQAIGGTATGIYNAAAHPVDTAVGLYNVGAHPVQAYNAISQSVVNTWNSGLQGQGRIVGNVLIAAGTLGSGAATATTRAAQIAAAEPQLAQGMSTLRLLATYDRGAQALNAADYAAYGAELTSPLYKGLLMQQGVDLAGDAYAITTPFFQRIGTSVGLAGTGLTPGAALGAGVVGAGAETVGWREIQFNLRAPANKYARRQITAGDKEKTGQRFLDLILFGYSPCSGFLCRNTCTGFHCRTLRPCVGIAGGGCEHCCLDLLRSKVATRSVHPSRVADSVCTCCVGCHCAVRPSFSLATNVQWTILRIPTRCSSASGEGISSRLQLARTLAAARLHDGCEKQRQHQSARGVVREANNLPIAIFRMNWRNTGNMAWEFAAPLPHSVTVPTRTMTYDDDNRLATFDGTGVGNDNNGNLTSGPLTNSTCVTYRYDARNRLLDADGVTNVYDAMNNRISQTFGTNTTEYVVNPNAKLSQVLMRIKNGVTNYYIYEPGLLYQITETTTATNTLTYHYDYRGLTIALTADNGLVTDRIQYSAYGLTAYRTGISDTPFLFNGRYGVQTDPNGLLYMRARYYSPYLCGS